MGFHQLIEKVAEAEKTLEAQGRSLSANLRQTRNSWHAAWTPGRLVVAGLVSGFLVGHGRLVSKLGGSNLLQLMTGFASLISGGMQAASAQFAQMQAAAGLTAEKPDDAPTANNHHNGESETLRQHHEKLRRDGLV